MTVVAAVRAADASAARFPSVWLDWSDIVLGSKTSVIPVNITKAPASVFRSIFSFRKTLANEI